MQSVSYTHLELFGPQFLTNEGALDRAKLRAHVFAHPQERSKLEALLHPLIRATALKQLAENEHQQHPDYQILPFSTGVILEPLPVDKVIAGLPAAIANLKEDNWLNAAEAIMTTDIVAKGASRQIQLGGKTITLTGISKGSGMIHPNMATMLGYIATDAAVSQSALESIIQYAVNQSFNCITVDGDTSTNDSLILMATHLAGNAEITETSPEFAVLRDAFTELAIELAQAIVRDGEGATKFMTVQVEGGRDAAECRKVAYAIAHSPLIKTAFFASDPNFCLLYTSRCV